MTPRPDCQWCHGSGNTTDPLNNNEPCPCPCLDLQQEDDDMRFLLEIIGRSSPTLTEAELDRLFALNNKLCPPPEDDREQIQEGDYRYYRTPNEGGPG